MFGSLTTRLPKWLTAASLSLALAGLVPAGTAADATRSRGPAASSNVSHAEDDEDLALLMVAGSQLRHAVLGTSPAPETTVAAGEVQGPKEGSLDQLGLAAANVANVAGRLFGPAAGSPTVSGPGASKVIGTDTRTQVTATTSYPWRAICHVSVTWPNNTSTAGSGFFITSRTVMTAGHVIYNASRGGWAKSITVSAGRNGSSYPYTRVTVGSSALVSVTGYTQQGLGQYDYAAIELPSTTPGASTGWFGWARLNNSSLTALTVNVAGYPGDKPAGTMWTGSGKITSFQNTTTDSSGNVVAGELLHNVDTEAGQSGSPIWYVNSSDGSRRIVGVHTAGNTSTNFGSRLGTAMQSFIQNRP